MQVVAKEPFQLHKLRQRQTHRGVGAQGYGSTLADDKSLLVDRMAGLPKTHFEKRAGGGGLAGNTPFRGRGEMPGGGHEMN